MRLGVVVLVCLAAGCSLAADEHRAKLRDPRGKRNLEYSVSHPAIGSNYRAERRLSGGTTIQLPVRYPPFLGPRAYVPKRTRAGAVPPYAVQMEPLVQYSQRDPLYDTSKLPLTSVHNDLGKPEDLLTDNNHLNEHVYRHGHNEPVFYQKEPEPIIEIIIKESNVTAPPVPVTAPPPKKKEPVQVFYVKYKKNPNGTGKDSVIYDAPVPALTPIKDEEHVHHQIDHPIQEYVTAAPAPSTTIRTIIRPESETFIGTKGIHVTFGGEAKREKLSEEGHVESAPQPSVIFPNNHQPHPIDKRPQFNQPVPNFHVGHQQQLPSRAFQHFNQHLQNNAQPLFQQNKQRAQVPQTRPFVHQQYPQRPPQALPPQRYNFNQHPPFPQHVPQNFQHFPPQQPSRSNFQYFNQRPQTHFPVNQQFQPNNHAGHSFGAINHQQQKQVSPVNHQQSGSFFNGNGQEQFFNHNQHSLSKPQTTHSNPFQVLPQQHQFHQSQPQTQHFQQLPHVQQQHQFQQIKPQQANHQQDQSINQQAINHHKHQFQVQQQQQQFQQHQQHQQQHQLQHQQLQQQNHQQQQQQLQNQQNHQQLQQHQLQQQQNQQQHNFLPPGGELIKAVPKYEQHLSVSIDSNGAEITRNIDPQQQLPNLQPHINFNRQPSLPPPNNFGQNFQQPQVQPQFQFGQDHLRNLSPQEFRQQILEQFHTNHSAQPNNLLINPHVHQNFDNHKQVPVSKPNNFYANQQAKDQNIFNYQTTRNSFTSTTPKIVYHSTTSRPISTTAKPIETTTEKKKETTLPPNIQLPDEVPDELRQQLLSSGILSNADISVLDYDKVGDIPIDALPPDQLANFYGAGGAQQLASASEQKLTVVPPAKQFADAKKEFDQELEAEASEIDEVKTNKERRVEMKVVHYDPESKEGQAVQDRYVRKDATQVEPVVLNDSTYNKYLPIKISGAQFPIPDVPELRGRNVTSVVVLAPIDYEFEGRHSDRNVRDVAENVKNLRFIAGDALTDVIKNPTSDNYKKWLEIENSTSSDKQSVVLLVTGAKIGNTDEKEIYMYDVATQSVNKLSGELSSAFVEAAESNVDEKDASPAASSVEEVAVPFPNVNPKFDSDLEGEHSEIVEQFVDVHNDRNNDRNNDLLTSATSNEYENKVLINSGYTKENQFVAKSWKAR